MKTLAQELMDIFRTCRSYAGTGVAVKVVFNDSDIPAHTIGKKAEGYLRNSRWIETAPSTYKILAGIDWPLIAPTFKKFPQLLNMIDYHNTKTKIHIQEEAPSLARAIKL